MRKKSWMPFLKNEQTLYDPTGVIERKSHHIQERIQERFTEIFSKRAS